MLSLIRSSAKTNRRTRRYGVVAASAVVVAMGALVSPTALSAPQHTGVSPLGWPEGAHQVAEMTAGVESQSFGMSVAISRDKSTAVVGAPNVPRKGSVYVFRRMDGSWTQTAELTPSDRSSSDSFGGSVAVSATGSTIVVGAAGQDASTGEAYVFTEDDGTWTQTAKLAASDGAEESAFGKSVAVSASGATVMVGASGHKGIGAAYVFTDTQGAWAQTAELTSSDGFTNDYFGIGVSLSAKATTALITAPGHSGVGAAYIFTDTDGTWAQDTELTASDGEFNDEFGYVGALSARGSSAVIGSANRDDDTGAAYVFTDTDGSWTQAAELTEPDGAANDEFGYAIAISAKGSTVAIGADGRVADNGAVYVFAAKHGAAWTQRAELTASDSAPGTYFGNAVALSGNGSTVIAGAVAGAEGDGAAYIFRR